MKMSSSLKLCLLFSFVCLASCRQGLESTSNAMNQSALGIPGKSLMSVGIFPETLAETVSGDQFNEMITEKFVYDSVGMWKSDYAYYMGTENKHHYFIYYPGDFLAFRKLVRVPENEYSIKKTLPLAVRKETYKHFHAQQFKEDDQLFVVKPHYEEFEKQIFLNHQGGYVANALVVGNDLENMNLTVGDVILTGHEHLERIAKAGNIDVEGAGYINADATDLNIVDPQYVKRQNLSYHNKDVFLNDPKPLRDQHKLTQVAGKDKKEITVSGNVVHVNSKDLLHEDKPVKRSAEDNKRIVEKLRQEHPNLYRQLYREK